MEAIDTRDWLGHVIVCGLQGLGVRIVELLQSAGIRVVVVGNAGEDHHLRLVQALDVPRIDGSPRNPESLWAAGLAGALAVVCAMAEAPVPRTARLAAMAMILMVCMMNLLFALAAERGLRRGTQADA